MLHFPTACTNRAGECCMSTRARPVGSVLRVVSWQGAVRARSTMYFAGSPFLVAF